MGVSDDEGRWTMSDDRTHQPTAKRRKQAREEGRVAATSLFGGALSWLALSAFVLSASSWLVSVADSARENIEPPSGALSSLASDGLVEHVRQQVTSAGLFTFPLLAMVFGLSVLSRLSQVGFLWLPTRLLPDAQRLSPGQRLAAMFSAEKLVQMLRGFLLVVCALALIGWGISSQRERLLQLLTVREFELETLRLIAGWGLRLGGLLVLFAFLDYAYQRYRFEMSLRMSAEEMRAEVKAVEGNSQVASERKAMHRAMSQRMQLEDQASS